MDVSVYVVEKTPDMEIMRNEFMTYIGGQVQVQCSDHKLPLIVNKTSMEKCYRHLNESLECCNRKLYYKCPTLGFNIVLCKRCYNITLDDEVVVYINPPDVTSEDICLGNDEDLVDDESCDNAADINDLDNLLAPMEHDDIDDYVILGGDIDITPEEVHPEDIPTTLDGDIPFVI